MLELFQKLFIGHVHKYVIIEEVSLYTSSENYLPSGKRYVCQYEHCGKLKFYVW